MFALLVAALALVAACAGPTTTSPASNVTSTGPGQLEFTTKTLDGADFAGQSLAGKPAVLWFWSPWCSTCQREAPSVAKAAQENPQVTFVGVAAQDQVPAMKEFVATYKMGGFTQLADLDASVWRKFGVTNQPAFAFVAPDGSVEVVKSTLSEQELAQRLNALAGA